jgi:sortase A
VKRALSWAFIIAGAGFVAAAIQTVVTSYWAEREAAEEWERPSVPTPPNVKRSPVPLQKGETFARLAISRLGVEMFVVEGAGRQELKRGPGHLVDTAFPGQSGNCIIAGHRDMHFRILKDVKPGEDIVLETPDTRYRYRVVKRSIVYPTDTRALQPTDTPTLTLVTCYPFYYLGPAPKRFIVRAELVGEEKRELAREARDTGSAPGHVALAPSI